MFEKLIDILMIIFVIENFGSDVAGDWTHFFMISYIFWTYFVTISRAVIINLCASTHIIFYQ